MGAASTQLVIATFFNFNPTLVRDAMAGVWEITTPGAVLEARQDAADAALTRAFGARLSDPDLSTVAVLTKRAALAACEYLDGRPLFAGHASLRWPSASLRSTGSISA